MQIFGQGFKLIIQGVYSFRTDCLEPENLESLICLISHENYCNW
ncbi:hypothetical protein M595_4550 [Lyngbya aestuarii BL J]|uniref:Uncharacterized protein n=1 Tax=Lyngbya aestuarii BL J TaxID=1348334 RepID=U7QGF8_9CYAN|nr:hypothetical protein M595_4550 [Lyngbya aestuarii BL J]